MQTMSGRGGVAISWTYLREVDEVVCRKRPWLTVEIFVLVSEVQITSPHCCTSKVSKQCCIAVYDAQRHDYLEHARAPMVVAQLHKVIDSGA